MNRFVIAVGASVAALAVGAAASAAPSQGTQSDAAFAASKDSQIKALAEKWNADAVVDGVYRIHWHAGQRQSNELVRCQRLAHLRRYARHQSVEGWMTV